jgi:heptosyltransferase-1
MSRVLLIKTSSLGDVVHNLPVVHDIRQAMGACCVDWVVEEAYAPIPALHPGIDAVIPVAVRRWRRSLWRQGTRDEVRAFLSRLRSTGDYDAVIDTQGLLKSAIISRAAPGRRYGFDWRSAREPLGWLYDQTFRVAWSAHAVERNRSLVAKSLGYAVPAKMEYGIRASRPDYAWLPDAPYAVMLHATSAASKLWPEDRWVALGSRFAARGLHVVLPWGNTAEQARSARLARAMHHAIVPPPLGLGDAARVLAGARCVVGLDTGLTHLAGALGVPTVGVYVSTDPAATGLYASSPVINVGGAGIMPRVAQVSTAMEGMLA